MCSGLYFAYKTLWMEYLTDKKRKSLNILSSSTIGLGAMTAGALMGNYLYLSKSKKVILKKSTFIPNRLKILALLFCTYATTAELMDRNLLFWGAGSLTLLA